jgi:hypothetical protein
MANLKQQLWEKLLEDIEDLSKGLQKLLRAGFE